MEKVVKFNGELSIEISENAADYAELNAEEFARFIVADSEINQDQVQFVNTLIEEFKRWYDVNNKSARKAGEISYEFSLIGETLKLMYSIQVQDYVFKNVKDNFKHFGLSPKALVTYLKLDDVSKKLDSFTTKREDGKEKTVDQTLNTYFLREMKKVDSRVELAPYGEKNHYVLSEAGVEFAKKYMSQNCPELLEKVKKELELERKKAEWLKKMEQEFIQREGAER